MPPKPRIAGVVVAYHPNLDLLNRAIATYAGVDRLYVFANSDLADYQPPHPNAAVVLSAENLGVSGALNRCAQRAIAEGYEWLLTMDQDSQFLHDGFDQLIRALDLVPTKTAILGPDYLNQGRRADRPRPVRLLIQSGSLVHLPTWQILGGFDEALFIDGVDHDYCLRARAHGFGVYEWPQSRLEHALGDLHPLPSWLFALHRHDKRGIAYHQPYREFYEFRNNLWLLGRHGWRFPGWALLRTGYLLLRLLYALSILPDRRERLKAIGRGIRSGFRP